jgi:hypothetical protein
MFGKPININQLRNKKSDGNQIIYFEYTIEADKNNQFSGDQVFRYYKINPTTWRVELVTQPNENMNYRLFSEVYQLPNNSVPLTVVCGIGMAAIKEVMEIEVQYYSTFQFIIAEEINNIANQSSNRS